MALDVESIWAALAERLEEKLADVKSVRRRFRASYTETELPAVVVLDDDGAEDLRSDPDDSKPVWKLSGDVWIIARTVETDAAPTTQLNALIKSVREALEFDPMLDRLMGRATNYTNLGGAVRVLAVTKVEKSSGALGGNGVAQMTITMETRPGA